MIEDEEVVVQPLNFGHYGKLMHLVPEALCSTRGGVMTKWNDPRPEPTQAEIDAVTDEEAELAMLPTSEQIIAEQGEVIQAILDASPGLRAKVTKELKLTRGK